MKGYCDIHCHLLPGIDDGAKSTKEMMQMVKIAYEEGIRRIIATPHYHPRRGEADAEVISGVFDNAKTLIQEKFPDMELYTGNEIFFRQDAKNMLKAGELLTLAGSDYVLIEFPTLVDKTQVKSAINMLQMAGYMPIIAHVERYEHLVGDYSFIREMVDGGVYFQVNASSVIGELGGSTKRFIKKLLNQELVHFVGTDAHSPNRRAPLMEKCASYITRKFDKDMTDMLLSYHPSMLIKNKVI